MPQTPIRRALATLAASCASFALAIAAHAAPTAGDLVKLQDDGNPETTADSAVYYVGSDGKRYAFPNAQTYFTWYANFDKVKIAASAELSALQLGGNITYRPGTRLVKIVSDPKVYAVEPSGSLRPIASEAVAKALYGDAWNKRIDDVADVYFTNYSVGEALGAAVYPNGAVVKRASDSIYFRIENGTKRLIAEAVRPSLRLQDAYVLTTSSTLSEYPDGTAIDTAESSITDTAQRNAAPLASLPTFSVRAPATAYVPVGADATFIDLGMGSTQGFTVRKLALKIAATTNNPADPAHDDDAGGLIYGNNAQANLTTIRLVDENGLEPFGRKEVARVIEQDQSQTLVFDGTFVIPAGVTKRLRLVAKVNGILPSKEGYQVTLLNAGTQVVDSSNGQGVVFMPAADLAGPVLSTLNASLEVSAAGTPGNKTYVRGTKNAAVAGFVFKATTVAPNVVTGLTVQGYIDEEGTAGFLPGGDTDNGTETRVQQIMPTVYLYDEVTGAKVAGPASVTLQGKAVFTGFTYAILAGKSGTLVIKGDIPKELELENQPDRIAFDILTPSENVTVVDDKGNKVPVVGINLNDDTLIAGVTPVYAVTVKKTGKMDMRWNGAGGNAIAGSEVQLGTLDFDPKDDDYAIRTLAFIQSGSVAKSLGKVRLEYATAAGTKTSVSVDVIGNSATFSNLPLVIDRDKVTTVTLFGKLATRDGGAVNGEVVAVNLAATGPLEFVSRSTDEVFSASSLGTDFKITTNKGTSWRLLFTGLTAEKAADNPLGPVYHSSDQEVLRFNLKTDAAGPARIKKLSFRLSPADAGKVGANNDALERWARANGDFEEDDGVITLRRVVANEIDPIIGAGSSGHIHYAILRNGTKSATSSTLESVANESAQVDITFDENSEYFIPAGTTAAFSLAINGSVFVDGQDNAFAISLLGGTDFLWSDIPSGAFTPLTGTDAVGTGLSHQVIVKQ